MQGAQLLTFFTILVPLLLFNVGMITSHTLAYFTMTLNCLSVIVFIAVFFFMNFKMTGIMLDRHSSELIKKVYALLLTVLISRVVMSTAEIYAKLMIKKGSFEDWISIMEENRGKYIVLGLCFILYLIIIMLTEGLPLIMSLRDSVVSAMLDRARSRSESL